MLPFVVFSSASSQIVQANKINMAANLV